MFHKICIRNKILFSFFILLFFDLGVIYMLENRVEKEVLEAQSEYNAVFSYNTLLDNILTGNIQSSFVLNKSYTYKNSPVIDDLSSSQATIAAIQKFRNQVLAVFGVSLLLGVVISIVVTRSIAKPIIQFINGSYRIVNADLSNNKMIPRCTALNLLTESIKHIKQDLLEHAEEKSRLESVEITKNLAAGIAHEIKNPINAVGLIADYIQTNLSPDDPGKRYEFYKLSENMKKELKRINRTVEGFQRLTKPNIFHFKKEDINRVIQDSVSLFEPEMVKQGIQVHLHLDSEVPPITADRDRLRQVFSNLIINAIEAIPRGGDITLSTAPGNEGMVKITISDNGVGIPVGKIKKVFNPYYTTKKQGFGLGLSLIQDIIHKHHGRITINSREGRGTEFIILLPVAFQHE